MDEPWSMCNTSEGRAKVGEWGMKEPVSVSVCLVDPRDAKQQESPEEGSSPCLC